MDCSPLGSSVHGILPIPFTRGSSRRRGQTWVFCIAGRCFTIWATRCPGIKTFVQVNAVWGSYFFLAQPTKKKISSVQFSRSVVSDSLRPHESQHTRPPCPSPSPGVHSNSRPSSRWCHPAISSSVIPFSSCPQSLPASGPFPVSQLFAWGGQSTGVSASASFLPKKIDINRYSFSDSFPL